MTRLRTASVGFRVCWSSPWAHVEPPQLPIAPGHSPYGQLGPYSAARSSRVLYPPWPRPAGGSQDTPRVGPASLHSVGGQSTSTCWAEGVKLRVELSPPTLGPETAPTGKEPSRSSPATGRMTTAHLSGAPPTLPAAAGAACGRRGQQSHDEVTTWWPRGRTRTFPQPRGTAGDTQRASKWFSIFTCFSLRLFKVYFESASRGGAEREREGEKERVPCRLRGVSTEADAGLEPKNCEIVT